MRQISDPVLLSHFFHLLGVGLFFFFCGIRPAWCGLAHCVWYLFSLNQSSSDHHSIMVLTRLKSLPMPSCTINCHISFPMKVHLITISLNFKPMKSKLCWLFWFLGVWYLPAIPQGNYTCYFTIYDGVCVRKSAVEISVVIFMAQFGPKNGSKYSLTTAFSINISLPAVPK